MLKSVSEQLQQCFLQQLWIYAELRSVGLDSPRHSVCLAWKLISDPDPHILYKIARRVGYENRCRRIESDRQLLKSAAGLGHHFAQPRDLLFDFGVGGNLSQECRLKLYRIQVIAQVMAQLPQKAHNISPRDSNPIVRRGVRCHPSLGGGAKSIVSCAFASGHLDSSVVAGQMMQNMKDVF